MAKTKVSQWDSVAANNTDINSININEGCPPSTINNAIRETMAQIKDWQDGSSGDGWTSTGTITSNGTLTSNGLTNINGSVYLDGSLGTNGQVLTSVGSTNTPVWSSLGTMSAQNSNAVAITGGAIATTGDLNVTGSLKMDGATGSSGQYLTSVGSGTPTWTTLTIPTSFVAGMIMLWSGTVATIPTGWLLCNGSSGTPDLRNRFVIGAHSDSGGVAKTTVTGSPTLNLGSKDATLVSHNHTASSSSENAHSHTYNESTGTVRPETNVFNSSVTVGNSPSTTSTVPAHNHAITVNSAGSSATNANLPPYYALAYIMKS